MTEHSFPRDQIRTLLLEGISPIAAERFRQAGYSRVETRSGALQGDELAQAIQDVHFLGIRSRTQLTSEALAGARKLVAVGCFCIGTNQVDLAAARRRGVPVFNAPYSNTRSVAELVLAETVLLMRRIPEKHAAAHRGEWRKSAAGSHEVRGKTLGIVGYGHIGAQVGVLAEGLGMRVLFHDVVPKLALGNAESSRGLADLLARSDAVTLHVPETPETRDMVGERELDAMREGAVLLNASRGNVVDIDALVAALDSGRLAGAAIDVFPTEPKTPAEAFVSPLVGRDDVILTPHVGGSTEEAQAGIGTEVADKLVRYSDDGSTQASVGFPEVVLPSQSSGARLLHVHENRPGMLGAINEVIGESSANVDAQFLRTYEDVGYVVTDVDLGREEALRLEGALRRVEGTLRSRVLF
ncbi:MAG: phosphoglycerate dehydrogenase [Planctomycetota bacterium]